MHANTAIKLRIERLWLTNTLLLNPFSIRVFLHSTRLHFARHSCEEPVGGSCCRVSCVRDTDYASTVASLLRCQTVSGGRAPAVDDIGLPGNGGLHDARPIIKRSGSV